MSVGTGPATAEDMAALISKKGEVHLHRYAHGIQRMWGLVLTKETALCGTDRCFRMKLKRTNGACVKMEEASTQGRRDP